MLAAGAVVALAIGLYGPFAGNPRVFDDWLFFSGQRFSYYATHPFGLAIRVPPLFTLAVTEVLIGGIEAHRYVNLAFHVAVSLAVYKLVHDLLRTGTGDTPRVYAAAFAAAAVFAVHPVAVYGAGYLIQRTIVLATLFSLLSVVLFARGLRRKSHADALSAAMLYSVAVLCKEHALLVPAVALGTVPLIASERRFALRHSAIYLFACTPAAILVVLLSMWLIGEAYEPHLRLIATDLESIFGRGAGTSPWLLSAVTQAGLFYRYLGLWLWPDSAAMSIDLRVDFFATWTPGWIVFKIFAFAAFGALGLFLLMRRGRAGIAGLGLLWFWTLFLVEFSTARFQEPFVLYRSYLWGPGILLALAAVLGAVPVRATLAVLAVAIPALLFQAHDRLVSFSGLQLLWEDAVAKLPARPVPLGSRTLYNLAREYMYADRADDAKRIALRCMDEYPDAFHCNTTFGMIHFMEKEYAAALPYAERAAELNPKEGVVEYRLGAVFQGMGRTDLAKEHYRRASKLGFKGADFVLDELEAAAGSATRGAARDGATDPLR